MHLKAYIQSERGKATALADDLGIALSYLSQMASGERAVTPERAAAIRRATNGSVEVWDTRPLDWHLIWPMLVGAEGAPAVPVQEADHV
jgi:DNA-binding transcriptional regulator YdaS (Cro superfamily)